MAEEINHLPHRQVSKLINQTYKVFKNLTGLYSIITIGKVNAGNKEYSFMDELKTTDQLLKTIYYRLEIVDNDGSKTYSEIKKLEVKSQNQKVNIYPNPSKNFVNIECAGAKKIFITDYLGKIVYQSIVNYQLSI